MTRSDLEKANVGDVIWIAQRYGWSNSNATGWTVTRKTGSGQLVVERDGSEKRITPRGTIVGEGDWSSLHLVTAEVAERLNRDCKIDYMWTSLRSAADELGKAAHRKDMQAVDASMAKISSSVAELRANVEVEAAA